MKGLHFLEFNDHFRGKQIVVCAPGLDDCYLIFISRSVLFLIAPYGTDENHSGDTEVKIICKEYVQKGSQEWVSVNVTDSSWVGGKDQKLPKKLRKW